MVDGTEDRDSGEDDRVLEEAEGRMGLSMMGLSLEGSLLRGSSIHTVLLL
jgi:hypothetical protein